MSSNDGWPEAFGFSIDGCAPVYISSVVEEGSAQQAGLLAGDIIVELNGENVRNCSREELVALARSSTKVPPSLIVLSRLRSVTLNKGRSNNFGLTFRGDAPVFIRSVEFASQARKAGLRSGDLVMEVDGVNVRYCSKYEVLELFRNGEKEMSIVVVSGGLEIRNSVVGGGPHDTMEMRYKKAKEFNHQMQYYLIGDDIKRTNLVTLLRLYAKDHNIDNFGRSVALLLVTPTERKLIPFIKNLIHPDDRSALDGHLAQSSGGRRRASQPALLQLGHSPRHSPHHSPALRRDRSITSSLPNLLSGLPRLVTFDRSQGEGFGFTLSGNAPVFIRSVDRGGAADRAGLTAGDYILEINGLSVRTSTHSNVVQLLKGSGASPTLLVSSELAHSQAQHLQIPGPIGGSPQMVSRDEHRRLSILFKSQMHQLLPPREEQLVVQKLEEYRRTRNVASLVGDIVPVLNDDRKAILLHQVCQFLPAQAQDEFDQRAASMLGERSESPTPSSTRSSALQTESVTDLLSRVQSGHLVQESVRSSSRGNRSSRPPGGRSTSLTTPDEPNSLALSRALHSGQKFGSDLDLLPVKEEGQPMQSFGRMSMASRDSDLSSNPSRDSHSSLGEEDEGGFPGVAPVFPSTTKERSLAAEGSKSGRDIVRALQEKKRKESNSGGQANSTVKTSKESPNSSNVSSASTIPPPPPPPMSTPLGTPGAPGAPPPPPPPAIGKSGGLNVKRVNWQKLAGTNLHGTVWSQMGGSALQDALEYVDLEEQFTVQPSKKSAKQGPKKPSVLDHKKAYNISILLGHMKLPTEEVKRAILSCDEGVLIEPHLRQMEAFAPSKSECAAYTKYMSDPSVLSPADQFTCEMSTIPSYRERLKGMVLRISFHDKITEIKPDLESIMKASRQLQDSKGMRGVLELILAMGNHLNAGNQRIAQAAGFKISFLSQLKGTKTADNKSTLLHYLVHTIQNKFPHFMSFHEDLSSVEVAARVSNQTLDAEMEELRQGILEINRELDVISSGERVPGDCFVEVMSPFLREAEKEFRELTQLHRSAMMEFRQAAKFFGEDPLKTRVDDFFAVFATFVIEFQAAVKDIETEKKKKEERSKQKSIAELVRERKRNNSEPRPERV
jgi:S1-C subfamily serine protease